MPQRLRVFISSPTDVPDERLRADLIIDRLSQDYSRFFNIQSYRWEHEAMLSSKHFQDAIEPPSAFDIVVLILWSRLGTPLPEKTAEREYRGIDGRTPVTGTEWEYEEALKAAREKKAPDLLAFRNVSPAPIDTRDPEARARSIAQLDALDWFWRRHFADRGVFLTAYDEYRTLGEFGQRFEQSLRKLIERRIKDAAAGSARTEPIWLGEPFRGLESYEFEHAPIFFGRDAPVTKATEQLAANARSGRAFLLVSGASGSGKSSLVKAGIVPRLMKPQRISGMAFLRRAVFRPGREGGDVFLGLARLLTRPSENESVGLPELIAKGQDAAQLAAHLRGSEPGYLFANALGRLTDAGRQSGHLLAFEDAKLIFVVDQLEEMFTVPGIGSEDRRLFVQLLAALARSGVVWLIATLRADFWHRAAEIPELVALAEGQGRIDLAAPSLAELAEMIRKPAEAAGLSFEAHPESGLGLDAVLAEHAAAAPGALPLLSFTLDELYKGAKGRGEAVLTHANYKALGDLEGAIANRADEIMRGLPAVAQAALPRVLRALTTVTAAAGQAPVARPVLLANFAEGTPPRILVDAFVAARLLVAASEAGAAPTVRLAHEALISRWQRARDQLATDRRDLETRTLVERQFGRWSQASDHARRLLLLRNPDLVNALDLARRWGDELDPAVHDYIRRSAQRARLAQTLTAAVAVMFALVAGAALYAEWQAVRAQKEAEAQRQRAEDSLAAATKTANSLVFDLADRFRDTIGIPATLIEDILDRARALQEQLIKSGQVTPDLKRSEAAALIETADSLLAIGDTAGAYSVADQAQQIIKGLLAGNPDNTDWQIGLSYAYDRMGDVQVAQGNLQDSLSSYSASLQIKRRLTELFPTNLGWQYDLTVSWQKVGDVQVQQGNLVDALASYKEDLQIAQRLVKGDPANHLWQSGLSVSYDKIGDVQVSQGDLADALASYRAALVIRDRLAKTDTNDARAQRDLSISYQRVGNVQVAQGNLQAALQSYRDSLAIAEGLTKADPSNVAWQNDLSIDYEKVGDVQVQQGNLPDALVSYSAELDIMKRLIKADSNNREWQRGLSVAYLKIGEVQVLQGNLQGALQSHQNSLTITEELAKSDPSNAGWQHDLSLAYDSLGYVQAQQGDVQDALSSYNEEIAIMERLVEADPDNVGWQHDLAESYAELGGVYMLKADRETGQGATQDRESALAAERRGQTIMTRLVKLSPDNAGWKRALAAIDDLIADFGK